MNNKPYELLAAAIIINALNDAINGDTQARSYLLSGGYDLFNSIGVTQVQPVDWITAINGAIERKQRTACFIGDWS